MHLGYSLNSYKLKCTIKQNIIIKIEKKPRMIGGMNQGLSCSKAMLVSSHLALVDHHTPFALVPLEFFILALRGLSYI
jgi:hypothetical protein